MYGTNAPSDGLRLNGLSLALGHDVTRTCLTPAPPECEALDETDTENRGDDNEGSG